MLDTLEQDLKAVHQNIEREYMRLGREYKAEVSYAVFDYLREYHTAWDLFLDRLQHYGDPTVIFGHDDVPGVIGQIGNVFGRHKVNIGQMSVGRDSDSPGGAAIGVLNLDSPPAPEAIRELTSIPGVHTAKRIDLPKPGQLPYWLT